MSSKRKRNIRETNAEQPRKKQVKICGHNSTKPETIGEDWKTITIPQGNKPPKLPACDGPEMQAFATGNVKVTFVTAIGDPNARHAHVYHIKINNQSYAFKIVRTPIDLEDEKLTFKFKTWDVSFGPEIRSWKEFTPETLHKKIRQYYEPFNAECRAYGRIAEKRLRERFWKCYGYLRIPFSVRPLLERATRTPDWQIRITDQWDRPEQDSWDLYGLVKELAPEGPHIVPKTRSITKMRGDLRQLHRNGVFNNDVADRNYMQGRLVDFSSAITIPYLFPPWRRYNNKLLYLKAGDGQQFDDMVREAGIKTKAKAWERDYERLNTTRAGRRERAEAGMKNPPLWQLGDPVEDYEEVYSD